MVADYLNNVTGYPVVYTNPNVYTITVYIKILVVRPSVRVSVCDGCGHGRNEFAGRVQNHYVRFSFHVHINILIILEIVKTDAKLLLQVWTLRCRLREGCHCGCLPSHYRRARTQDYMWLAGLERDTIFHLCVTACKEQGSHCHD